MSARSLSWQAMRIALLITTLMTASWGATPEVWDTSSYLGGSGSDDVASAAILSDGTIILGASISNANPGGIQRTLNGASSTSGGALVLLSPDGHTVLSVTRIGSGVRNVAIDAQDNIYVAAVSDGLLKLDRTASTLLWRRNTGTRCIRVDVAANGDVAGLWDIYADDSTNGQPAKNAGGLVSVHDGSGNALGSFSVQRGDGSAWDVAIDGSARRVFVCGYKNTSSGGGLSVPFIHATDYDGTAQWTGYDFAYADVFAAGLTADSFGVRIAMGRDGKLYLLGMESGGNTVFGRNPQDLSRTITQNAIDQYTDGSRMGGPAVRGWYARYDAGTGGFLGGSVYQAVTPDPSVQRNRSGLFFDTSEGEIAADEDGRVYICASKTGKILPFSNDPLGLGSTNGSVFGLNSHALTVLAPDLNSRLFVGAVVDAEAGGRTHAVAARVLANAGTAVVYGGRMNFNTLEMHLRNPIQASRAGIACGFYAVAAALDVGHAPAVPVLTSPLTADATLGTPFSYTLTASGTTPVSFTATGLPGWLTLQGAVLSGTPSGATGSLTITIGARNAAGSDSRSLVLTIHPLGTPVISGPLTAAGLVGQPFTFSITATGAQPLVFSAVPLPDGLTVQGAVITGIPTTAGTTSVALTASNGVGADLRTLVLSISASPGRTTGGTGVATQGGGNCGLGAWAAVLVAALLGIIRSRTLREHPS